MSTSIQQNLVEKNERYAAGFKDSGLALPPAKKYAVCKLSSRLPTSYTQYHPPSTPIHVKRLVLSVSGTELCLLTHCCQ